MSITATVTNIAAIGSDIAVYVTYSNGRSDERRFDADTSAADIRAWINSRVDSLSDDARVQDKITKLRTAFGLA